MGVKHAVITSVDRDDLPDGGAEIWAQTVRAIRHQNPGTTLETLIPDFAGKWDNLQKIIQVAPEVVSHNLETVRRMTKAVRIQAKYDRSLEVIKRLSDAGIRSKSGVMLGLGETYDEVVETMEDLRAVGCEVVTLGTVFATNTQASACRGIRASRHLCQARCGGEGHGVQTR